MRPPSHRLGHPPERLAGRLHRLCCALLRYQSRVRRLALLSAIAEDATAQPQLQHAYYRYRIMRSVVARLPQHLTGGAAGLVRSLSLADSRLPALLPTLNAIADGCSVENELELVRGSGRDDLPTPHPFPYRITVDLGDQQPRALPRQPCRRR